MIIAGEVSTKFKVVLYQSDERVAACAPSLPGCWSQSDSTSEALNNIANAIQEYLGSEIEPAEGAEVREVEDAVYRAQAAGRHSSTQSWR
jgi:predicted RNase H-like HicB family nuclease